MDELTFIDFLKKIMLFSGILGALTGIDLLLGAKITSNLKKVLDEMTFNVDKIIIKVSSAFRSIADKDVLLDRKIVKTKARVTLGLLFIVVSAIMIYFARKSF